MRALRPVLISGLCGLILALPYRWYEGSLPCWFALAPVLWIVANVESARMATLCAAAFALCWTGSAFSFLINIAAAGMVALVIYTSLYYIAALLLVRRIVKLSANAKWGPRGVFAVFGTAALWAIVEIIRSRFPVFGFPWLLLGHSLTQNDWLRQGADVLGVFGLSFLLAAFNAWLAFVFLPRDQDGHPVSEILGVLLLATLGYGAWRVHELEPQLQSGPPIALIQGNILQKLHRTREELIDQVHGHIELHKQALQKARAAGLDPIVVCWAETMVPGAINCDDEYSNPFHEFTATTGIPTIAGSNFTVEKGADAESSDPDNYNAVYLLDGSAKEVCHYFKRRLVPFGEYVPFTKPLPFMKALRSVTEDRFLPGSDASPVCSVPINAKGSEPSYRIAFNICVEDIHPDLAREAALSGADTLVNVTNDGWFYGTHGPRAHMLAAAWRAIETRRPLLRITNTGYTVAVDPLGRIELLMEPWTVNTAVTRLKRLAAPVSTPTMTLGELGAAMVFFAIFLSTLFAVKKST